MAEGGGVDVGEEFDERVVAALGGGAAHQLRAGEVAVLGAAGGPVGVEQQSFDLIEEGFDLDPVDVRADEADDVVVVGELDRSVPVAVCAGGVGAVLVDEHAPLAQVQLEVGVVESAGFDDHLIEETFDEPSDAGCGGGAGDQVGLGDPDPAGHQRRQQVGVAAGEVGEVASVACFTVGPAVHGASPAGEAGVAVVAVQLSVFDLDHRHDQQAFHPAPFELVGPARAEQLRIRQQRHRRRRPHHRQQVPGRAGRAGLAGRVCGPDIVGRWHGMHHHNPLPPPDQQEATNHRFEEPHGQGPISSFQGNAVTQRNTTNPTKGVSQP